MTERFAEPQVVWDPNKSVSNEQKHGVTFQEAATIFLDPLLLVRPDTRHSQEEERWVGLGRSQAQLFLVVIHTENQNTIRIISARKAEPRERRSYEQQSI